VLTVTGTGHVPPSVPDPAITPARTSDLGALIDLFHRSSDTTRRERFHGSVRRLPCQHLRAVACGEPGVTARVARDLARDPSGSCVIGLATAMLESPDRAELAVWVVDGWQHRGVGHRLLLSVVDELRADGVGEAVAYVETGNVGALALARRLARSLGVPVPAGPVLTFDLTVAAREAIA
jgi:ribosomal protein S18 acetylase RimI-like enzyme